NGTPRNRAIILLNFCQSRGGINVTGDDENGIVWRVPFAVELFQHFTAGLIKRRLGSKRIILIGSTCEQVLVETRDEFIGGIRQITRNFLFNRAALLYPLILSICNIGHASGIDAERRLSPSIERWQ